MKKKIIFWILIILVIAIIYFVSSSSARVNLVKSDEFESMKSTGDVFVLNTHTPYQGEIEGTDLVIEDWQNIVLYKDKLPQDKNKKILVYCRSGRMSSSASQQLIDLGYKNIYDLEGGMDVWVENGKKLISKEN